MVYIEDDSEMGQALKDSINTVYTFRNAKGKDFCDLAPEEGTGLETWSKEEEDFNNDFNDGDDDDDDDDDDD